ncbi:MAG: hypothetical protein ACKO70_01580 [Actinomycetota bacterium]
MEDAAFVCGYTYVVDQSIQEKSGDPEKMRETIQSLPEAAFRAAQADAKYEQLSILTENFAAAVDQGDSRMLFELIAVEGECEQLGLSSK